MALVLLAALCLSGPVVLVRADMNTLLENVTDISMACGYALQALVCLVLLIQIKRRREQKKVRGVFFGLCFVGGVFRSLWFGIPDSVFAQGYLPENRKPANFGSAAFLLNATQFALYSIPNVLYAVCWIMLLCFWSSVLHLLFSQRSTSGAAAAGTDEEEEDEQQQLQQEDDAHQYWRVPEASFGGSANTPGVSFAVNAPKKRTPRLIAYRPAARFFKWSALAICVTQLLIFGSLFFVDFLTVVIATCLFLCAMALFALVSYIVYAFLIVRKLRPVYRYVLRASKWDEASSAAAAAQAQQGQAPFAIHQHLLHDAHLHPHHQMNFYTPHQVSGGSVAASSVSSSSSAGGTARRLTRGVGMHEDGMGGLDSDVRDYRSATARSQLDQPPSSHSNSPSRAGAFSPAQQHVTQLSQPMLHAQHLVAGSSSLSIGVHDVSRTLSVPSGGSSNGSVRRVSQQVTQASSSVDELSYVPDEVGDDEEDEEAVEGREHMEDDEADTTAEEDEPSDAEGAVHALAAAEALVSSNNTSGRSSRHPEDEIVPIDRRVSPGIGVSAQLDHFSEVHVLPRADAHAQLQSPELDGDQHTSGGTTAATTPAARFSPMRQPSPTLALPFVSGVGAVRVKSRGSGSSSASGRSVGAVSPEPYTSDGLLRPQHVHPRGGSKAAAANAQAASSAAFTVRVTAATDRYTHGSSPSPHSNSPSILRVGSPGAQPSGHMRMLSSGAPYAYAYGTSAVASSAADQAEQQLAWYAYRQARKIVLLAVCVVLCSGARIALALIELHFTWKQVRRGDDGGGGSGGQHDDGTASDFPSYWWAFVAGYYLCFELLSFSGVAFLLTQRSLEAPMTQKAQVAKATEKHQLRHAAAWQAPAPYWNAHAPLAAVPGYAGGVWASGSAAIGVPSGRTGMQSYAAHFGVLGSSAPSASRLHQQHAALLHGQSASHSLTTGSGGGGGLLGLPSSSLPTGSSGMLGFHAAAAASSSATGGAGQMSALQARLLGDEAFTAAQQRQSGGHTPQQQRL